MIIKEIIVYLGIQTRKCATIFLTDAINTEINCSVTSLQMSNEVTTGHNTLQGYELYDLVAVNENEFTIVIAVGIEKLKILNHLNIVKDLLPQELRGKKSMQSSKGFGFNSQKFK